MRDWEPGWGAKSALAMGLTVLALIALGFNRPEVAEMITRWQTLIAAMVALFAAFVAYEGATAATREALRKSEIEREAQTVTTCMDLIAEIGNLRAFAHGIPNEIKRAVGSPKYNGELAEKYLRDWIGISTTNLTHARHNIGAYNRDLREPLISLWASHKFSILAVESWIKEGVLDKQDGSTFHAAQMFCDQHLLSFAKEAYQVELLLQHRLDVAGIPIEIEPPSE